jgi:hypothetical protein
MGSTATRSPDQVELSRSSGRDDRPVRQFAIASDDGPGKAQQAGTYEEINRVREYP